MSCYEHLERTFGTIQREMRHEDVSVFECSNVPQRDFPEWSMAYASANAQGPASLADIGLAKVLEHQSTAAAEITSLLRTLVIQDDDYACV